MTRLRKPDRKRLAPKLAVALGFLALFAVPFDIGWSDDTFLFRVQSGKPYVWVVFDTSSSMNLSAELGGALVESNADDPLSTFHQAKSAVYEVFNRATEQSGDFIHFGLMTYNQDGLRVRGKHWLYAGAETTNQVLIGGKPYPLPGELLTFGADLPTTASPNPDLIPLPAAGVLGTCESPIEFTANRQLINRFPKLHPIDEDGDGYVDDMLPHWLFLREDETTYLLTVERHSNSPTGFLLNESPLKVDFKTWLTDSTCTFATLEQETTITVDLVRPFIMHDLLGADNASDIAQVEPEPVQSLTSTTLSAPTRLRSIPKSGTMELQDLRATFTRRLPGSSAPNPTAPPGDGGGAGTRDPERQVGIWNYQDYTARAVCGDDAHPFTGQGGEMNYDGGTIPLGGLAADYTNVDPYQIGNAPGIIPELTLKYPTTLETAPVCAEDAEIERRTLDVGDMLPYHWERTNREEFFRRLAPNWTPGLDSGQLDFGIATYFKDVPLNGSGFLELVNPNRKPLLAFGDSPVGEALVDWRCFYLGEDQPGGKCRNDEQPFGRGFDWLAPQCDLEWGCRKPFIIVIGDGENNCRGENPAADTANLRRNRIKAWVINFGGPDSRDLRSLARNTGGEYIEVDNKAQLLTVLENILGEIVEETRAFASAVVPTVQAEEADKIFVSNFKPLNQASVWPGNVQAFLKPVPVDGAGRPDTTRVCGTRPDDAPNSLCFLWETGLEMLEQVQPDMPSQFGDLPRQRRVYYSRLGAPGSWPLTRRYTTTTSSDGNSTEERYDLWRGLNLFTPTGQPLTNVVDGSLDEATEDALEAEANNVFETMMAMKVDDNETPDDDSDDVEFILGDVFHSDPLIVGTPINTKFFALNLEDDGTACEDGNPSYRCYFRKHQNRRKLVLLGSNDGLIHAIDAGIYRSGGDFAGGFDRGTGKEVFAFMPRAVMPRVKATYGDGLSRNWTVDGSLTGLDVFIDPVADADDTVFPNPDDREWRTVVLGGLRRGGRSYYALDVTQPDTYGDDNEPTGIAEGDYVPSCAGDSTAPPSGCGPVAYPSQLWEFTDSKLYTNPPREVPLDLDQDGLEDLMPSWSTPSLGLMKVCVSDNCDPADPLADIENRYVAVVGGGLDKTNATGNWVYIIDIETGKSIYKRQLLDTDGVTPGGSVAAETAAVDTDGDGYLDRVYLTTTRGFVYRIELRGPNNEVPRIEGSTDFTRVGGVGVPDMEPVERILSADYRPHIIFKAQANATTPPPGSRAMYYRPAVIYSAALGQYVLAFGVGDRENLWSSNNERGRFYLMRDDIAHGDYSTFYTEADLEPIDTEVDDTRVDDLLTDPTLTTKGWYMLLRENERLITSPFGVSGVIVFTVFDPDVDVDLQELTCSRTGRSRVFGVSAVNGNGLLYDGGSRTRWFDIADFVTEPYVEQAQTKNPDDPDGGDTADDLTADHLAIMDELKNLFPSNCKFANYRLDIKTLSSDTGIHLIAPIPICIVEKNWKEF